MDIKNKKNPRVIIFGRTNVGKSTLFNRLTEKRHALTSEIECTTRDSNRKTIEWRGMEMELVDTGGIMDKNIQKITKKPKSGQVGVAAVEEAVQKQALDFLKQGDLILFVVDGRSGLLPQDEVLASFLKKRYSKKTLLVVNKIDHPRYRPEIANFYQLNLGHPLATSANTGGGTGDLLDEVVQRIPPQKKELKKPTEKAESIKVCIMGKPNVGKSSLLNSLLQDNRVIVSDLPHTTREPQDTEIDYQNKNITLVDTAGISKKGSRSKGLEKFGISRSLRALKKSDIALLVVDISQEITHQDAKLVEEIFERKKSLIIVANKWDLVEDKNTKEFHEYIHYRFPYATWAPVHFVSASTGSKVKKIFDTLLEVQEQRKKELSQSQLDKLLSRAVKIHPPAKAKGIRAPYIYKINQTETNPPHFIIKIRKKDDLHFSYIRFIINQLRENFGFLGTPISIEVRSGETK